jgi:hypothetical protein
LILRCQRKKRKEKKESEAQACLCSALKGATSNRRSVYEWSDIPRRSVKAEGKRDRLRYNRTPSQERIQAKHYTLVLIVVVLLKKSQKTGLLHKTRHHRSIYLFFVIFRCV